MVRRQNRQILCLSCEFVFMIYHVFVDFGLFSFMNCINNFSICVKIYCQIHILSFLFIYL